MLKNNINSAFLVLFDFIFLAFSIFLAFYTRNILEYFLNIYPSNENIYPYFFSGTIYLILFIIFLFFGLYTKRNDFWEELKSILKSIWILFVVVLMYVFLTKTSFHYSRIIISLMFFYMIFLIPFGRYFAKSILYKFNLWQKECLVAGQKTGQKNGANAIKKELLNNWYLGYLPVDQDIDCVGGEAEEFDTIFIPSGDFEIKELKILIERLKNSSKEIIIIPYLDNISFANADILELQNSKLSLINIQNHLGKKVNILIKNSFEYFILFTIFPIFVLLFIIISILVKLDSKGSILFVQNRIGKNNKIFKCYKFRSMHSNSEEFLENYLIKNPQEREYYSIYHKYNHDPRVTKIGKWLRRLSLDELPQIINIIKGEMSLIGPRPYMEDEISKIDPNKLQTISLVKPGITGFWQVGGRNEIDFQNRQEMDVWYISNWSLWLDFIIFIKTFKVVFSKKGAK